MLALILILVPILTSVLIFISNEKLTKALALAGSFIEFALVILALINLNQGNTAALTFNCSWISSLGINFNIAIDGISLFLVHLTALLTLLTVYASFNQTYHKYLYGLILLMEGAIVGVFVAMDGFLFYVFWEITLIPIYFICFLWGGQHRKEITFKFFVYTLFGSLFMLMALVYIYVYAPVQSFDIQNLYLSARAMSLEEQGLIMAGFLLAFAVKLPIVPFHSWQPMAYADAPIPGVMILGGVMSKMAAFGIIRWILPMVPQAVDSYGYIVIIITVFSIIYTSCIAVVQTDFKHLIAYSSIAHVGLITVGLFAMNIQGILGGFMEMLSHGINTVGLFFIADIVYKRTGTTEMHKLGGIRAADSKFALLSIVVVLSALALPFTMGFVGEFLLLLGLFERDPWAAAFAAISIVLGALYMLRAFQLMMLGKSNSTTENFAVLTNQELITLVLVAAVIIGVGVYPNPMINIPENSVNTLLEGIK